MPYHWYDDSTLILRPYRSLPPRGFAVVIGLFFLLAMIPLFGLLGTALLWALLPFAMIGLGGLWIALRRSYRDGEITERLTFTGQICTLTRDGPRHRHSEWQADPYWVRVQMHETGGPVPYYVTLVGNGREVEIGAFLSEDERKALHDDLLRTFTRHKAP